MNDTRIEQETGLRELVEALRMALDELRILGRDLQEIEDGVRSSPTALLNVETVEAIEAAIAKTTNTEG